MRELERLTGITRMTINFYIKEGLLPEPEKTARNMAYYSQNFIDRLKLIFKLRSEYHFSLAQIRTILESAVEESDLALLLDVRDCVFQRMSTREIGDAISWNELVERTGLDDDTLKWVQQTGLVTPEAAHETGAARCYHADNVVMGQLIHRLLTIGISRADIESFLAILNQIASLQKQIIDQNLGKYLKNSSEDVQRLKTVMLEMTNSLVSLALLRMTYQKLESES